MGEKLTRELEVVCIDTGEVIHRVNVTGRSEREIGKITSGMLLNMRDDCFIRDTALEARAALSLSEGGK